MSMSLLDLRESVLENVVRDDLSSNRLDRYINAAIQRIARYHNWRDLYVKATADTESGQGEYALPLGEDKIKDLISMTLIDGDSSAFKLDAVPYRRLHELVPHPSSTTTGRPKFYTVWDDVVQLFPVPDGVYTLEILYVKWPVKLEAVDDTPDLVGLDDAIVAGSTFQCFLSLQQKEDASFWNEQFNLLIRESIEGDVKHTDHALRLQGYRTAPTREPSQDQPI